jgi:hypothetical protein
MEIIRCPSCDGFAWVEDDFSGASEDCDWCGAIGYLYHDDKGLDHKISRDDLKKTEISTKLESLEKARLREMGFTGEAKTPWEQDVRKGTQGGVNPYEEE